MTSIGDSAFAACMGLTSLTIPNSVQKVGAGAFTACIGLENVVFEQNSQLTEIGETMFASCVSLTDIVIPSSVTRIGLSAFAFCTGLKNIIIPSGVNSIGIYAFAFCNGLESIVTIYLEAGSALSGLNNLGYPVVSGCTLSTDKSYVASVTKSSNSIYNSNKISNPCRKGYEFGGWYTDSSFTGTRYSTTQLENAPNGTYYAKWTAIG